MSRATKKTAGSANLPSSPNRRLGSPLGADPALQRQKREAKARGKSERQKREAKARGKSERQKREAKARGKSERQKQVPRCEARQDDPPTGRALRRGKQQKHKEVAHLPDKERRDAQVAEGGRYQDKCEEDRAKTAAAGRSDGRATLTTGRRPYGPCGSKSPARCPSATLTTNRRYKTKCGA